MSGKTEKNRNFLMRQFDEIFFIFLKIFSIDAISKIHNILKLTSPNYKIPKFT